MNRQRLVDQLVVHEGLRRKPYLDTVGKTTIGVGRNLADVGISTEEAYFLLGNDIDRALKAAQTFEWFAGLSDVRQNAIVELIFNMGLEKFKQFIRFRAAMATGYYEKAAAELTDTPWERQVGPNRSGKIIAMIKDGAWQ